MSPKVRDRIINSLIGVASGTIVAIITFSLNSSRIEAQELTEKINKKLDKSEFADYKSDHQKKHDKDDLISKEFRDWLKEQMEGLREDVRDLRNKP